MRNIQKPFVDINYLGIWVSHGNVSVSKFEWKNNKAEKQAPKKKKVTELRNTDNNAWIISVKQIHSIASVR